MTQDMRVIEIAKPGGPEVLTPARREIPVPKAGEVVIRVAYARFKPSRCTAAGRAL